MAPGRLLEAARHSALQPVRFETSKCQALFIPDPDPPSALCGGHVPPGIFEVSVQNHAIICKNHPAPSLEWQWAYACEPGRPLSTWCVSLFASQTRMRSVQGASPLQGEAEDKHQYQQKSTILSQLRQRLTWLELCARGHQI